MFSVAGVGNRRLRRSELIQRRAIVWMLFFVSYAANLVLPRVGEVSRCGMLAKYDDVSFAKSLGTVVTERLIDTLTILLITGITFSDADARLPSFLKIQVRKSLRWCIW